MGLEKTSRTWLENFVINGESYWRSATAGKIFIFQMGICPKKFKYGSPTAALDRAQDIVRGGEALASRRRWKHCSRVTKNKDDFRVVLRVSFLFPRMRLILKSVRSVAVRIHAEGINLQGLRVVYAWMKISSITRTLLAKVVCKSKAEEGQKIGNPFRHMQKNIYDIA